MIQEHDLKATVSRGSIKPIYLLVGNDPYLTKHYANLIAKKSVPQNPDFNLFTMQENCSLQDIYDRYFQFSFTGERICVLASNFDFEGCPIAVFKELQELAENPSDCNVLVLYYDVLNINTKKSDRFKKLAKSIEKGGGVVCELNHKTETELAKMLTASAAKRLRKLDISVAKYMISVCGTDLNILINELEKLCAFVKENEIIEKETVDEICVKTLEASVYDITRYMLQGKPEKVYHSLNTLLASGVSPNEIHTLIVSAYVDIFRVKAAVEAGKKPESIAADFGYPNNRIFVLNNAARDGKYLTQKQIGDIINEILKSDSAIKSNTKLSGNSSAAALEILITKILKIAAGSGR